MPPESDISINSAVELTLIPGIGTLTQNRILKALSSISDIFSMDSGQLQKLGVSSEACPAIRSRRYRETAAEIFDWSVREGCRLLIRGNPDYPGLLEEIYDPPLIIYARGRMEAFEKPCISVVGTRKPTIYGLHIAQGIAADLSSRNISIVSGLARGIDGAAHRGCIESNGTTVAVLGCGIDIVYPREHRQLAQEIIDKGLILSEFPPGTPPVPQNFPLRNRIISGLALGTLIIEASENSGSLITARLALEQNREIFATPGNLTSPQSYGPNFLIKQGAKLIQTWRDVVEELPPEIRCKILMKDAVPPDYKSELELLSEEETGLMEFLKTDEAVQFDKIHYDSGISIPRLSDLLLDLELKGWVRRLPGNLYVRAKE
jgi:DNA processing protein